MGNLKNRGPLTAVFQEIKEPVLARKPVDLVSSDETHFHVLVECSISEAAGLHLVLVKGDLGFFFQL